ncbi:transposase [Rubellimicrobium roseum]|uniref:Transposase n=1 Tax=Rubellimicrobium roseum TaxID=687525 RepID=A0A5C4NJA1_9RHOB|nr:transposase [Rubellimicrobium roseum]
MREFLHRLVFLDETSVRTGLTRLRGRCPRGEHLYGSTPFGRWHSQTFVAGLTCDELIAPWIIPGAMDQLAFDTYVETQLAPVLVPGTAVILDNLSTHRSPRAAAALKGRGCWFLFLPPYSPDLNPIEMALLQSFAAGWLDGARTRGRAGRCRASRDVTSRARSCSGRSGGTAATG